MNWLWRKLGLAKFVREVMGDLAANPLVHELQQDKFYLIVFPQGVTDEKQLLRLHRFLEERGIECLIAMSDRVQLVELGQ